MMLKGQDASQIKHGNSFSDDGLAGRALRLPAGEPAVRGGVEEDREGSPGRGRETKGFAGRFGAGLPRINDGSFLFLQHMISKMKPVEQGGSRLAIVFNGSPLFTGAAGSGESEIRRWIIENDWLEAVVALPDQLFYNTGISTYFWIVTNRKSPERRGKVQLIDARELWQKMRKSLGEKRKELSDDPHRRDHASCTAAFEEGERVKILPNESFGFLRVTVERPLRRRWVISEDIARRPRRDQRPGSDLTLTAIRVSCSRLVDRHRLSERTARTAPRHLDRRRNGQQPQRSIKELVKLTAVPDPEASVANKRNGDAEPDPDLRDQESVTLPEGTSVRYEPDVVGRLASPEYVDLAEDHLRTEVHPYVPDAWIDHAKAKIGYEIPVTRHFYRYVPPRPLAEIDTEIKQLETRHPRATAGGGGRVKKFIPLRRLVECLDGRRVPLNREQRSHLRGEYPYWGANGIVDYVNDYIFDEDLVLLGEDGAPFHDRLQSVAFLVHGKVWVNNHIHALRPLRGVEGRYLTYALNTVDWTTLISGSTRDKLTQDDMMRAAIWVPDQERQHAIANYLDTETARSTPSSQRSAS